MASILVVEDARFADLVRRCYVDAEVRDRGGTRGRGWTNLKRIYGYPSELRLVVEALAEFGGDAEAVASADEGSAPLAALVASRLALPVVFVSRATKHYGITYGDDPSANAFRLVGERLRTGSLVYLVDDFVHLGETLIDAADALRQAGLTPTSAAALLGSPPASIQAAVDAVGIDLTILVRSDLI
jgi:adenine/guanine phosphoribosyltransferase-like PRPP-binding protein